MLIAIAVFLFLMGAMFLMGVLASSFDDRALIANAACAIGCIIAGILQLAVRANATHAGVAAWLVLLSAICLRNYRKNIDERGEANFMGKCTLVACFTATICQFAFVVA